MKSRLRIAAVLALGVGAALCLAGCGHVAAPSEIAVKVVHDAVPASCPVKDAYDALKAGRPRPLREQSMPATAEERVAKQAAQLGKFEAAGGWADKVEAALDRCQIVGVATPP